MHRLECLSVWGGNQNIDADVRSQGLTATVFSSSSDGGKGGDVYYFSLCSADLLTRVAIADVVGHGQAVSNVSQWVYDTLQKQISSLDNKAVLSNLNELAHNEGFQAMTTAAVISYFLKSGLLSYAYAGHPPFFWRDREKKWKPLDIAEQSPSPANLPLGIMSHVIYDQAHISVNKGDRFIIYTDGVIECQNDEGLLFGQERLMEVLTQGQNDGLVELKNRILDSLLKYSSESLSHDDVTFIIIEIN